jgi:DNA repair exonuclease SbcCD ATPase subunit
MGSLRVNKVVYSGQKYFFESDVFNKNIILIEGDNGTGKSTLCNLIYFALGGRVDEFKKDSDKKHKEITSDKDNYVELYISINGDNYLLRRFLSENDITVMPYVEKIIVKDDKETIEFNTLEMAKDTKILSVYRREDTPFTFSDWILEKLDIAVVELYHGYKTFKINFTDLMRLIYHDQQPDPENIYKKIDVKSNYFSDSELLRKAIFELLVGKSFSDFYDAIVKVKRAEKDKSLAKNLVDEYTTLADKIRGKKEIRNKNYLQEEIENKDEQLEKLQDARNAFKRNRNSTVTIDSDIDALRSEIMQIELGISDAQEQLIGLYDERYKLVSIKGDTIRELEQIQKVIHTHDQLNLFSSDTCPYCLTEVERAKGHCVCGSSIEEEQYERFFYTSQEYNEILKAKTKSLSTIEIALNGCNEEINGLVEVTNSLEKVSEVQKIKFRKILGQIDQTFDLETINDIDDKILDIREEIGDLKRAVEIESKLEVLQADYNSKRDLARDYELERKELEIKAQKDITNKVNKFSKNYNRLMTETLSDCRSARIKLEDYMPSINDGEYREASAKVSIRLMYYLTLLKLSLTEEDVTFPKFLLIDTPETAGIEMDNLIKCIKKFQDLDSLNKDYQVILATGLKKYPDSLKDNRVLYMPTKSDALLKLRE